MVGDTPFLPSLSPVAGKAVVTRFDSGRLSSKGGQDHRLRMLLIAGEAARSLTDQHRDYLCAACWVYSGAGPAGKIYSWRRGSHRASVADGARTAGHDVNDEYDMSAVLLVLFEHDIRELIVAVYGGSGRCNKVSCTACVGAES